MKILYYRNIKLIQFIKNYKRKKKFRQPDECQNPKQELKKIVGSSITISFAIQIFFMALLLLFPKTAFGIFTNDEEVLEYALRWFIGMAIGMPAMATMGTFNSLITAVGDTRISMIIGIADALIGRIASTVLLGIVLNLGAMGLFVGYNLGVYISAIPGAIYYFCVNWKRRGLRIAEDTDQTA